VGRGRGGNRAAITVIGPAVTKVGGEGSGARMAPLAAAANATFGLANTTMVAASTKAALSLQSKDLP